MYDNYLSPDPNQFQSKHSRKGSNSYHSRSDINNSRNFDISRSNAALIESLLCAFASRLEISFKNGTLNIYK